VDFDLKLRAVHRPQRLHQVLIIVVQFFISVSVVGENASKTFLFIQLGVERVLVVDCALDGVDQDGVRLLKHKVADHDSLSHAIRSIQVDVKHALHLHLKLLSKQVVEACKQLHVSDLVGHDAGQLDLEMDLLELLVRSVDLSLLTYDWHSSPPVVLKAVDLVDGRVDARAALVIQNAKDHLATELHICMLVVGLLLDPEAATLVCKQVGTDDGGEEEDEPDEGNA